MLFDLSRQIFSKY